MATLFRDLSYRYQCLYDAIARLAALSVGGDARLGQLALQNLTVSAETKVLDLQQQRSNYAISGAIFPGCHRA